MPQPSCYSSSSKSSAGGKTRWWNSSRVGQLYGSYIPTVPNRKRRQHFLPLPADRGMYGLKLVCGLGKRRGIRHLGCNDETGCRRSPMRLPKECYQMRQAIETHLPHLTQSQLTGLAWWVCGTILAGVPGQNAVASALSTRATGTTCGSISENGCTTAATGPGPARPNWT